MKKFKKPLVKWDITYELGGFLHGNQKVMAKSKRHAVAVFKKTTGGPKGIMDSLFGGKYTITSVERSATNNDCDGNDADESDESDDAESEDDS